jgi:hypothetical protein
MLYALTIAGIVYLFVDFTGCPTNNAFISATLIGCVVITAVQLTGEEGSLLSSGTVCFYATYLVYAGVTKNPDPSCNPTLGLPSVANIVLGLVVCALGLGYTGWSNTAEGSFLLSSSSTTSSPSTSPSSSDAAPPSSGSNSYPTNPSVATPHQDAPVHNGDKKKVTGVVVGGPSESATGKDVESGNGDGNEGQENPNGSTGDNPRTFSTSWRLNAVLATISCWTAVTLTEWGAVNGSRSSSEYGAANPGAGNVSMWLVIASQWIVLLLYLWTLLAPRLFPGRDFS